MTKSIRTHKVTQVAVLSVRDFPEVMELCTSYSIVNSWIGCSLYGMYTYGLISD